MATTKTAPEVETVTMLDGRIVEFAGKRKILKAALGDPNDMTIRMDFRNGESRTISIPEELAPQFAVHGALQKFGDECAGVEDLDDAIESVDQLMDRIAKGDWNMKRESGGMSGASTLVKALMELTGKPVDAIRTFLEPKSQAEKIALRGSARLKPIVDRIEAEKAANAKKKNPVDTDALLGELDAA